MNKIVINARFLTQNITGVQRFAIEISLRLKESVENIEFVTPSDIRQQKVFVALGAKVIGSHHGHLWEQIDLPKYLKQSGNPLLVNLANMAPLFYKNKIVTIHDVAYKIFPQTYPKTFLLFYSFVIPRLLHINRHVVTVSEFSRDEISRFYDVEKKKISVVHNAVSNIFKPTMSDDLGRYFLAVSSMNYRKNFLYILDAFTRYQQQGGEESLFIIGDLKQKSFNEIDLSQYEDNPQIKFLGRVTDEELVGYYGRALAFIYPSFYEGFGIPPLEAQACHCPAICADASCLPEVFGDSVLYCNPYDPMSLMDKIKRIATDELLRETLIRKGIKNLQRYSWEGSAEKIKAIIDKLNKEI